MLQVGSFVLWHELKYRSFCLAVGFLITVILQFAYIDSLLLYPIHFIFTLYYYIHFDFITSSLYYSNLEPAPYTYTYSYVFFYPEVEYTNNILDSYYLVYTTFLILLILLVLPLFFYQLYLYIRPAMYTYEITLLNTVYLYVFSLLALSCLLTFKQFTYLVNYLTYNSYNYMEIHINFDLYQLFSYFILLLLFNMSYLLVFSVILFRISLPYLIKVVGLFILGYVLYHFLVIVPYTIILWYVAALFISHELSAYINLYKHLAHEK